MTAWFAPGCALKKYKPERIAEITRFLKERGLADGEWTACCKSEEKMEDGGRIIVCCPGCSGRFRTLYPASQVISLWKVLLETDFPFPDYSGQRMSIHDACRARGRHCSEMQDSARLLCSRMGIRLTEPLHTRDEAVCCGGSAKDYETRRRMALLRAKEFAEKNVVVYCTGCTRSFSVTDKAPRHLLDLLLGEKTEGLYPPKN